MRRTFTPGNYINANNAVDFIAKVVTCDNMFNNIPFLQVARGAIDLIVIVEIEEVFHGRGQAVFADYNPLMKNVRNAINLEAQNNFLAAPPVYDYVKGANKPGGLMMSAGDETYGFIYNTATLAPTTGGLVVNPANPIGGPLNDSYRLPFLVNFNNLAGGPGISFIANHAPPLGGGGGNIKYQAPIQYTNQLATCSQANLSAGANFSALPYNAAGNIVLIGGDFNCSITREYNGPGTGPFQHLWVSAPPVPPVGANDRFASLMQSTQAGNVNNLLTSLRTKAVNGSPQPFTKPSYLSEQYDDILYPYNRIALAANCGVLDIAGQVIGNDGLNFNRANQNRASFNAYLYGFYYSISDHLPVGIEF